MKFHPRTTRFRFQPFFSSLLLAILLMCSSAFADPAPKVVIISLDGATPRLIRAYQLLGLLPDNEGFGRLRHTGTVAEQNFTVTPSLTAVAHIVPTADVIVVSDHGFDPFFTSVSMNNMLSNAGFDLNKVRAVTSGPDVNLYINLQGREPDGTVTPQEYITLQQQLVQLLNSQADTNQIYTNGQPSVPVFEIVRASPAQLGDPNFGLETDDFIGQDAGDVVGVMTSGYNFDGVQSPVVQRQGDPQSSNPVLSVSNFYGAHGYNSQLRHMSAIFYAAGPDILHGTLDQVHNIDVAPTIDHILGVQPDDTVQGQVIQGLLK